MAASSIAPLRIAVAGRLHRGIPPRRDGGMRGGPVPRGRRLCRRQRHKLRVGPPGATGWRAAPVGSHVGRGVCGLPCRRPAHSPPRAPRRFPPCHGVTRVHVHAYTKCNPPPPPSESGRPVAGPWRGSYRGIGEPATRAAAPRRTHLRRAPPHGPHPLAPRPAASHVTTPPHRRPPARRG